MTNLFIVYYLMNHNDSYNLLCATPLPSNESAMFCIHVRVFLFFYCKHYSSYQSSKIFCFCFLSSTCLYDLSDSSQHSNYLQIIYNQEFNINKNEDKILTPHNRNKRPTGTYVSLSATHVK